MGSEFGVWGLGSRRRSPCRHAVRGFHLFAFALDFRLLIFPTNRAPRTYHEKKKEKKKKRLKKKQLKNEKKKKKEKTRAKQRLNKG